MLVRLTRLLVRGWGGCDWFDLQAWLKALATILIALIALQLLQQWGVWCEPSTN